MAIANVHEAVRQLKELRSRFMARQTFCGYSGAARAGGGLLAFGGAYLMNGSEYPNTPWAHVAGWGVICLIAAALNFGAVLRWYLARPQAERCREELKPMEDAIPALVVGGLISLALITQGAFDLLFGTWMCLFGLANLASRHSQPVEILHIGWFYVLAGAFMLIFSANFPFANPWPMGIVFFAGELAGGLVFVRNRQEAEQADA